VQNIGAYGRELKDICQYVEYIDLVSGETIILNNAQCQFAYRDSIFKQPNMSSALISKVTLKLDKNYQPALRSEPELHSAMQIYQAVCNTRQQKLPDPKQFGNAGSFFKNPVVSAEQGLQLLQQYPNMPHYPQAGGDIKLAAGWLIDQCQLKGRQIGGAAVHQQQALVLINKDQASANDIIQLAYLVKMEVQQRFNIALTHEVRFIGAQGETELMEVYKNVGAK
jgi:UDP-N-acetylmuramate dehydrogenase